MSDITATNCGCERDCGCNNGCNGGCNNGCNGNGLFNFWGGNGNCSCILWILTFWLAAETMMAVAAETMTTTAA